MSTKISDYKPLIALDIGTDTTKYSQSFMETFTINNILKEKINKIKKELESNSVPNTDNKYEGDHIDFYKIEDDDDDKEETPTNTPYTPNNTDTMEILYKELDKLQKELLKINPNTIYDFDYFVKTKPTLLYSLNISNDNNKESEISDILNFYNIPNIVDMLSSSSEQKTLFSYEYFGDKANYSHNSGRFPFEITYSGIVHDYQGWYNIVDSIGKSQIGSNYYNTSYSETPVLLMQKPLGFEYLQKQVRMQYEVLFEDFKTPYVLISSNSLINVLSNNETSGIVVDIGESGTSISTVVNGFTQYDNSIFLPFLSGRNITATMALIMKNTDKTEKDIENILNVRSQYSLSYQEYLEAKFVKESTQSCPFLPNKEIPNKKTKFFTKEVNYHTMSSCPYLLFYPEVFKCLYNTSLNSNFDIDKTTNKIIKINKSRCLSYYSFWENFLGINQLIFRQNTDVSVLLGEKMNYDVFNWNIFNQNVILPYRETESTEKEILITETSNISNSNLRCFRQLGMANCIISHIQKAQKQNPEYSNKLNNVYFSGGVLKTPLMKKLLQEDLETMQNKCVLNIVFPEKDEQTSFYKGTNYLTKLSDLDTIMISRKEYFENGSEQISYNYI